jgi:DNA-binding transcriptional LysR family regulator
VAKPPTSQVHELTLDRQLGIEIRHLAALKAVAQEGSFRGGAARLGYTQSAVSQQLATLETIVGQKLVNRPQGARPLTLTKAGELLLAHAAAIEARLAAARVDLAAAARSGSALRVGTYQSVAIHVLPTVLRRFAHAAPDVKVGLTDSPGDFELLTRLEHGQLDLAFAELPLPPGPFDAERLLADEYVVVVQGRSPLATARKPLALSEVTRLPLVVFKHSRSIEQAITYLRAAQRLEPKLAFRSDDNTLLQAAVAAGLGAALIPRLAAAEANPELAVLEIAEPLPPRAIAIAWHSERVLPPAATAFIELTRATCAEIEGSDPSSR